MIRFHDRSECGQGRADGFGFRTLKSAIRNRHGAGWSSPVARWAHNPKVAGSNPAPATKLSEILNFKSQIRRPADASAQAALKPDLRFQI